MRTRLTPSRRSSIPAARPAGPAPAISTSTFTPAGPARATHARPARPGPGARAARQRRGPRGREVEPRAPAVPRPGRAAQPAGVGGRHGARQRVADPAARAPLAVADDPPVLGVGGDPRGVLVGPDSRLPDI